VSDQLFRADRGPVIGAALDPVPVGHPGVRDWRAPDSRMLPSLVDLANSLAHEVAGGRFFVGITERRAGPSVQSAWQTGRVTRLVKNGAGLMTMPHVTACQRSPAAMAGLLDCYSATGVSALLALRGDPTGRVDAAWDAFPRAADFVRFIRRDWPGRFSTGVGIHLEGRPGAPWLPTDWRYTLEKLELSEFAITQFLLTAEPYLRFRDWVARAGVRVPIIPGVIPAVDPLVMLLKAQSLGVTCPPAMRRAAAEAVRGREVYEEVATRLTVKLCGRLLREGAPGIYIFTMNQPAASKRLLNGLAEANPRAHSE
jgi:methylenetetrahydrofolate reductase (NADPH)